MSKKGESQSNLEGQKGFTLVELLIAGALLSIISFAIYSVVDMSHSIISNNNVFAQLNQNAMQTLRHMGRELGETSPLSDPSHLTITLDSNSNNVLTFQIPVDHDGDGDVYSGTLAPVTEWGAYHSPNAISTTTATLNGWVRYSVSNNQLIREVLDSSLSAVSGTSRVVANNVSSFTVTQNGEVISMSLGLSVNDAQGRHGQAQAHTMTFSNDTYLRNGVS